MNLFARPESSTILLLATYDRFKSRLAAMRNTPASVAYLAGDPNPGSSRVRRGLLNDYFATHPVVQQCEKPLLSS